MFNQQLCIRADQNLDLHLKFSADSPNYSPHIIHKTANSAGKKTDSVAVTLVDVICKFLPTNAHGLWSTSSILALDAFDETHCGFIARKDRKVQVVFNDMTFKKRWHYGYEILDDGQ
ncbi:hypothetical protein BOTNAR_0141g00230 [Botryotinia narcissicola]|uniref:Uncharacterized protein n=1 Tax=Botryotinia narcissicola TaxID=278944 RepID=A0A4Z1IH27_9HELO|nr:hypothetical protein BOTNAR_0141g00230 [Botryotinia narcissicola]